MGILLLLSVAALACLAGWIAHSVEKWVRNRPSPRQLSKPAPRYQQPTAVPYLIRSLRWPSKHLSFHLRQPMSTNLLSNLLASKQDSTAGKALELTNIIGGFAPLKFVEEMGTADAGCPSIGSKHGTTSKRSRMVATMLNLITLCEFHHALMPDHLEAMRA
jgi:hypothetical protein